MKMHKFDPMRNDDGSLSLFRISCMGVFAVCLLSYASLSILGCSDSVESIAVNEGSSATNEAESDDAKEEGDKISEHAEVIKSMQEAVAYYRECGSLNKGFVGCSFEFPENIKSEYLINSQASDDGFYISMKAVRDDERCALFETDVSGALHAFDRTGQSDENCLK